MSRNASGLGLVLLSVAVLFTGCCSLAAGSAEPGGATRVLVADDFEEGIVKSVTRDPHGDATGFRLHAPAPQLRCMLPVIDSTGAAGVSEHAGGAGGSAKSIRVQNSRSVKLGHTPSLCWWLYNEEVIKSGTLRISFDLLIPKKGGAPVTLLARDFTKRKDHLSLACAADHVRLNDKRIPTTPGEWVHCALSLPVGIEGGRLRLTVNDARLGTRQVDAPLAGAVPRIDWIAFVLFGKNDGHVLLDNLRVQIESEVAIQQAPTEVDVPKPETAWQATPAVVLDVFPASAVALPEAQRGWTKMTSAYYPSDSSWTLGLDERWVFLHEVEHRQDEHNSFSLRIGKGGQIYSLRGAFGESVPPSRPKSPWNDEVWQFVAVCSKYNGNLLKTGHLPDETKAAIKRLPYQRSYFVHNSGAYIPEGGPLRNLYCPLLGAAAPPGGRIYRTVNWGLVPQVKTMHRSPVLYYGQTRDVGDGVIELTWVVHNFSTREDIVFNWLNAPWGGTRKTRLPVHCLSKPDDSLIDRRTMAKVAGAIDVRKTGGWNLSSASEAPDSPSLALVFGRDRHLEAELEKAAKGQPHVQYAGSIYRYMNADGSYDWRCQDWQTRPENSLRNYDVAVVIPKFNLAPGTTIWYRSYLVVNRRDRAIELAKSLVAKVDYGLCTFDPATTPLVPVRLRSGKVTFRLFAKPVPGTMPLFLIENRETGREVVTSDPYVFVLKEKLDLGLPADHPHYDYYSKAYGYSLDKHNSKWQRLLGYGYVKRPEGADFKPLSAVLPPGLVSKPDAHSLDLWVQTE
jgi:hypothetical protein